MCCIPWLISISTRTTFASARALRPQVFKLKINSPSISTDLAKLFPPNLSCVASSDVLISRTVRLDNLSIEPSPTICLRRPASFSLLGLSNSLKSWPQQALHGPLHIML